MSAYSGRKRGMRWRNLTPISVGGTDILLPLSRKVVSRRTKRVVGYFQSFKMRCAMPWESQIERDYFYCLEFDVTVKAFVAQPTCLNLQVNGQPQKHYPDLLVQYENGDMAFHEVKTDREAHAPDKLPLFAAARQHCASIGHVYQVVTESQIRRQPRLKNCQLLIHHRRRSIDLDDELQVTSTLTKGPATLARLRQALNERPDAHALIMSLTAAGKIGFQLDTDLTDESVFNLMWKC